MPVFPQHKPIISFTLSICRSLQEGWMVGVPMSHVNYMKSSCRPVNFKKSSCRPVDFKKSSCRPVDFKKSSCRMSLRPKKGRVAMSILGVHPLSRHHILSKPFIQDGWYFRGMSKFPPSNHKLFTQCYRTI